MDDSKSDLFDLEVRLSESDYVEARAWPKSGVWGRVRLGIAVAVLLLLASWPPARGVAIALLAILLLLRFLPLPQWSARKRYEATEWLSSPFRVGADREHVWIDAHGFSGRFEWSSLTGWRECNGWISLFGPSGAATLPVRELEAAGVADEVRRLAWAVVAPGVSPLDAPPARPIQRSGFADAVAALLRQRQAYAALILDRTDGRGFLQLATPVATEDEAVLEFGLPNADWARSRWEAVRAALLERGFPTEVEEAPGPEITRFLRVRLRRPWSELAEVATVILNTSFDAFGWDPETEFVPRPVGWARPTQAS